jgi:flagellin
MANSINTNIGALTAQKNMLKINNDLDDAMTRLSSGLRINSAADDAAGSAIASKMEAQVRSLGVAIRNSYDAISMTQTAEGALSETENMLQRIRELAVQAGNSTLSNSDRKMIQSEVDALITEIDAVSANTHFNDVKLLDGSNVEVNFQIGINQSDSLNVKLQKSDSIALGLSGSEGVKLLTSERVDEKDFSNAANTIAAADVKINGQNAFSTNFVSDTSASSANAALLLASAINLNSGVHGAEADAFNSLSSVTKGTFNMDNTFTINGDTVELATSYETLVANINQAVSGINAKLNSDNTVTLSNTTGASIIVAGTGSSDVGFTNGTYTGFVSLVNIDGSSLTLEANNEVNGYTDGLGTIADVNALGFNEQSVANAIETATVSGTALSANEIKINDVLIGESSNGSANSIALAINAKTAETGVTADAHNEVQVAFNTSVMPGGNNEFYVNKVNVDLTSATGLEGIVTAINAAGIGDVRATAVSDGAIKMTSASGVDINVIHQGDTDFIRAFKDINGTVSQSGIVGGSDTAAASLFAAADITAAGAMTILTPSNFNSQVSITSAGSDGANGALDADSLVASSALSSTSATLISGATSAHAKGVQIVITEGGTADGSDTTVTITGTDMDGNAQTETLLGAAQSATVRGTKTFDTITAISYDQTDTAVFVIGANHGAADTTFDITGVDVFGNTITETVRGEGGILAARSKNVFEKVSSISVSGTNDTNISIGNINDAVAVDDDYFFAAADIAANTAISLIATAADDTNINARISMTSTSGDGSDSSNSFIIVGTDMLGELQTETVAGPTAAGTVFTTKVFKTLTSVTPTANPTSTSIRIGKSISIGDNFTSRGNMTLTNASSEAIKVGSVASDDNTNMLEGLDGTFGSTETILQKVGLQGQSAAQEVSGTNLSVSTLTGANASLSVIDQALEQVSLFRSSFGAVENRIDASISNLTTLKVNTEAAQSRIQDADFAAETSNLTKSQILSQAATSMLAQANASKQNLLALLQG